MPRSSRKHNATQGEARDATWTLAAALAICAACCVAAWPALVARLIGFQASPSESSTARTPHAEEQLPNEPPDADSAMRIAFREGVQAQQRGDYQAAIERFSAAIRLKPSMGAAVNLGAAYTGLGIQLWEGDRMAEAIHNQRHALAIQPTSGAAYATLGMFLLEATGTKSGLEAQQALSLAVELNPAEVNAHLLLLASRYETALRRWDNTGRKTERLRGLHAELLEILSGPARAASLCGSRRSAQQAGLTPLVWAKARQAHATIFFSASSWLTDRELIGAAALSLSNYRPFTIAAALRPTLATKTHERLTALSAASWYCPTDGGVHHPRRGGAGGLWTKRCVAHDAVLSIEDLDGVQSLFDSHPLKELVAALTGERIDGKTIVQFTKFRTGDFLSLHSDAGNDDGEHRRVAFAWHLGRDWSEGHGGELAFVCGVDQSAGPSLNLVAPVFNQLTLFRTHVTLATSEHAVLPVIGSGSGNAERYAVTGWFTQRF
jgi:tetratricopeptide (TPR) repeat protein